MRSSMISSCRSRRGRWLSCLDSSPTDQGKPSPSLAQSLPPCPAQPTASTTSQLRASPSLFLTGCLLMLGSACGRIAGAGSVTTAVSASQASAASSGAGSRCVASTALLSVLR
ncbi:hypothetical protein AAT19DRAFT_8906 [Rhodotorula toruloides]|uniref:Uncharacterized protein n=1 Tax=Rhodotorula toruloides TaxID=5286 RepID=A0A2T0AIJ9_RHOTO|nr:hypothetical protein AAT19DRAFT_8906 [Rhodotorula toruloides]